MPLNPDDIKPGRTYEGSDGERREVCTVNTTWFSDRAEVTVRYVTLPHAAWRYAMDVQTFAAWAVREVV